MYADYNTRRQKRARVNYTVERIYMDTISPLTQPFYQLTMLN